MVKGKLDKTNPTDIKGINGILLDLSNFFAKTKIITKISTVIISKNTHKNTCFGKRDIPWKIPKRKSPFPILFFKRKQGSKQKLIKNVEIK